MTDSDTANGASPDRATGYRYLVQSMILMAMTDGHVADEEVEMIDTIHEQLTGERFGTDKIKGLVGDLNGREDHFVAELKVNAARVFEPTKDLIIKGCYLVLMADGIVDDAETVLLDKLAHALSISDDRRAHLIDSLGADGSIG